MHEIEGRNEHGSYRFRSVHVEFFPFPFGLRRVVSNVVMLVWFFSVMVAFDKVGLSGYGWHKPSSLIV